MFDESISAILFRLINFAALITLAAYIFRKYFRSDLEHAIEDDRLQKIQLHTQISELTETKNRLSQELVDQEKLHLYLLERSNQWAEAFGKQTTQLTKEKKELAEKTVRRLREQERTLKQEVLLRMILPQTVAQMHTQLAHAFHSEKQKEAFTRNIITYMKKS